MIEAHKDNWWAEKPKPVPVKRLGWRPIDPYCVQDIPYYPISMHRAVYPRDPEVNKGDRYVVAPTSDFNLSYGVMLQRSDKDGNVIETNLPNGTKFSTNQLRDGDIISSTVPLNQILKLHARYQCVRELLFTPSLHTPKLQEILLRGNRCIIDSWDFTNCTDIRKIENSIGLLKDIKLPPRSQDGKNFFNYAYFGHFDRILDYRDGISYPGESPAKVVDDLVKRAYFSNYSYTEPHNIGYRQKQFNSAPNNGHLYHGPNRTLPYHKILAQERNWNMDNLSVESFSVNLSNAAQVKDFHIYLSTASLQLDINLPDNPSWLSVDKTTMYYDVNNIQTLNISVTANNTGAKRTTTIWIRKLKTYDMPHEMHYKAKILITQNG